MEITKQVNELIISDNELIISVNVPVNTIEKSFFDKPWIEFSFNGQRGFWNKETQIAVPVKSVYSGTSEKYFDADYIEIDLKTAEILFSKDCPNEIIQGIKASKSFENSHWIGVKGASFCIENGKCADWNDDDSIPLRVFRINEAAFKVAVFFEKYDVFDNVKTETVSGESIDAYIKNLLECDKRRADLEIYDSRCLEDINEGHWELWKDENYEEDDQEKVKLKKPLIARNPLADIHYDGLIGIDFGTKSTIVSKQDGRKKASLLRIGIGQLNKIAEPHHYENPTVMELINLEKFLNDYSSREGRPETSIEDIRVSHSAEIDLKSCSDSNMFYSFLCDIKQWCSDTVNEKNICDQSGWSGILPVFTTLDHDEFNPLEIYAYYLGLYINNMRNGIYIDYILSFPVTYEKAVKGKILEAFTKGLKKSLPETVLSNKEVMSKFRVRQGVSEPAAYAVTALQGYGFEPDDDEKVLYSIFDFGGGTTDFDFGIWRCADDSNREEESYDYVIEHICSEGDRYLGGENLLELMAYELFKANAKLLQKMFSFTMPKGCEAFAGSETLISNSQEARRNTKQLMEVLRPFWEGIIGTEEDYNGDEKNVVVYNGYVFRNTEDFRFPIKDGHIIVDLFDKEGNRLNNYNLYVENKAGGINVNLIEILENRIEQGVKSYFQALLTALGNEAVIKSGADEMQIFLAGNSSKSPVLRNIFDKYIDEMNESLEEEGSTVTCLNLFPPLGTDEAAEIQKERGINVDKDDITAPTGKTGVAYGLIAGRESGRIKVISEITAEKEAKFRYYIAVEKRGKFKILLDRNKVGYGEWVRFGVAKNDFEFFYTSLPGVDKLSPDEAAIPLKHCHIDEADENSDIYIRAVSPEEIEYCVINKDIKPDDDTEGVRVYLDE